MRATTTRFRPKALLYKAAGQRREKFLEGNPVGKDGDADADGEPEQFAFRGEFGIADGTADALGDVFGVHRIGTAKKDAEFFSSNATDGIDLSLRALDRAGHMILRRRRAWSWPKVSLIEP